MIGGSLALGLPLLDLLLDLGLALALLGLARCFFGGTTVFIGAAAGLLVGLFLAPLFLLGALPILGLERLSLASPLFLERNLTLTLDALCGFAGV